MDEERFKRRPPAPEQAQQAPMPAGRMQGPPAQVQPLQTDSPSMSASPMQGAYTTTDDPGIFAAQPAQPLPQGQETIGQHQIELWNRKLSEYKAGKAKLEQRVRDAERWWKMRNEYAEQAVTDAVKDGFHPRSAWLHNIVNSKHADYLEAYPAPNILAREEGDKVEAWLLSKIVPVILEQNSFESIYDQNGWQKLKTGTAIYKITWDANKGGLGDISVSRRDLLSVYWEPGIKDIQDSRLLFDVEMRDTDSLIEEYPELEGQHLASAVIPTKFPTDDTVSDSGKVAVVDVYYKKKGKLHYCKYVGDHVLYATENDSQPLPQKIDPWTGQPSPAHSRATDGLYDHGMYPYVFDTLFPIEGSPAGYGYIDIASNAQTRIDLLNRAMLKNALVTCTPRYFERADGAINEEEFLDLEKAIVHINGTLDENSVKPISATGMSGNYITYLQEVVTELRETSGNTETSTGSSTNGVTAASALAALQAASGKTSRASTLTTYRCYRDIVLIVIELIRQFYDLPRQFRITGSMGVQKYITFSNTFMQPQYQGSFAGVDMGYRIPVYDVEVEPEKRTSYTKIAQNELALQLYGAGIFNPQMAQPALLCLSMMDFDGKDELMQQINSAAMMFQQQQMMMALASQGQMQGAAPGAPANPEDKKVDLDKGTGENKQVQRSRERAETAAQPGGQTA